MLLSSDLAGQSFLITSILMQNFSSDWRYFFFFITPETISYKRIHDSMHKRGLEPMNSVLYNICMSTPMSTYLAGRFFNSDILTLEKNVRSAIDKTIVLLMNSGSTGLLTYNLFICIKDYESSNIELQRAGSVVLFLHELSHFMLRINSKTLLEFKSNYTPENEEKKKSIVPFIEDFDSDEDEHEDEGLLLPREIISRLSLTEERSLGREESGNQTEIDVFGGVVKKITITASRFLLKYQEYPNEIENFQKRFMECNAHASRERYLPLSRSKQGFNGVLCSMDFKSKFTY